MDILADLFENEIHYFRPGQKVMCLSPTNKGYSGHGERHPAAIRRRTRTMKVRLEVDNPDYALRTDMFVDVELPIQIPPGISVPSDAAPRFRP